MFLKSIFSLFLSIAFSIVCSLLLNSYTLLFSSKWPQALLFFCVLFGILNTTYFFYSKSKAFTELLIVSLSIKLLIALVVIFIYSLLDKSGFFAFAIHFIAHYILFTFFEIRYLLQLIKYKQKNQTP